MPYYSNWDSQGIFLCGNDLLVYVWILYQTMSSELFLEFLGMQLRKRVSLCPLVENSINVGSSFSCYLQQASLQQDERKVTHRQKRKRREKKRGVVIFKSLILVVPKSILISSLLTVCLLKSCYVYVNQLPFSSPKPLVLLFLFFY